MFRSNTDMMLLTTRLRIDADGKPHIPGSLDVWKNLFVNHPHGKYDGKLTKLATGWKDPDDVLEALFALSPQGRRERAAEDLHGDQRSRPAPRAHRSEPATVDRLARDYRIYGAQYAVLNETPRVCPTRPSSSSWIAATAIAQDQGRSLRADAAGIDAGAGRAVADPRAAAELIPATRADATLGRDPGRLREGASRSGPLRRRPRRVDDCC